MATMINSYSPYMYHQQFYNYPTIPNFYYQQPQPIQTNTYPIQQQQQPIQNVSYPTQQQQPASVQYVDSSAPLLRPRRQPRIYRQVIVLPTPEPVYRQVRHRLPTPEREVIQRTVIQKANGDVVVQQQRPTRKPRSQSRSEYKTSKHSSYSRQVHTD